MIKLNQENRTITGETLEFQIDGNFHKFNDKITYAQFDVMKEGSRQKVTVILDVDKFGEENYKAEINWPSFGAEDIEFARTFANMLSIAISASQHLEELVKDYNN